MKNPADEEALSYGRPNSFNFEAVDSLFRILQNTANELQFSTVYQNFYGSLFTLFFAIRRSVHRFYGQISVIVARGSGESCAKKFLLEIMQIGPKSRDYF